MGPTQTIFKVRREYNQWVANETLEDYALRFTAKDARRWSCAQVGQTALGAVAFLALEALAATATLQYGFINSFYAMLALALVIFVTGIPISYYGAKHGLDIDLLTRGAGFGYLGSTVTSLIYASFTFIFFAIEAAIMASALQALFGIPLYLGYVICVLLVVPLVTHGITAISRFQIGSQALWLVLQLAALALVVYHEFAQVEDWLAYAPPQQAGAESFNLVLFGACSSLFFALVAQIGEQVDYLRFLPEKTPANRRSWWFWMLLSGPGWILFGMIKMLFGAFLAYLALGAMIPIEQATDPIYLYQLAYAYATDSPTLALALAGLMVVLSQLKINVTNAYAGSIAWSNFFSRLTHSHPGRVVWLLFNLIIALVLMELGIYRVLEAILGVFAIVAISWLGCLSADLIVNKPLGLSPAGIEYKRSHLYDINPVGFGSMVIASAVGFLCYLGDLGETARHLAHYISLACCFICVPLLAILSRSRYYLARQQDELIDVRLIDSAAVPAKCQCSLCENQLDIEDISYCPAYAEPICSLCCSLDARCMDRCKSNAGFFDQLRTLIALIAPARAARIADSRLTHFIGVFSVMAVLFGGFLALIYYHFQAPADADRELLRAAMWAVFYVLLVICGVLSWLFLLAKESRQVAQQESSRQTALLRREIEAHRATDIELQRAKDQAEHANAAKSRYLSGISHELRTPLQSMLGYAQLLQMREDIPTRHQRALKIIRNSGEHLADLIEGLLEISKIEAGRLELARAPIALPELLSQLVDVFSQLAEDKSLEFNFHLHSTLPAMVIGDEKRLRQILTNLLSNAIKYTPTGRVDFHVNYRYQIAEFEVIDTGIGIEADDLKRILKPFERVHKQQLPNISGTGLGLTIVHLLTEVTGSELSIQSTPALGSRFKLTMMLAPIDQAAPDPTPASTEIIGYQGPPKSVLVVDDEALHRSVIAELLAPLGFKVYSADSVQQGQELLHSVSPDIAILDVNMPTGSGLKLAHELNQRQPPTPIIMLSAEAREPVPGDARYDAYMSKPVRHRALLDKIGSLLKLQWRLKKPRQPVRPTQAIADFSQLPSSPLLLKLLEQTRIGYRKGVLDSLAQLAQTDTLNSAQLEQLNQLAEHMQFDKIESLLANVLT